MNFSQGTLREKLERGLNPTSEWGPENKEDREAWEKLKIIRRLSTNGVQVTKC